MNALEAPLPGGLRRLESEARQICDERGLSTQGEYQDVLGALQRREFRREIEPLNKMKADVFATTLPRITIMKASQDSAAEYEYSLTEQQREVVASCDEMIAAIAASYGLTPHP